MRYNCISRALVWGLGLSAQAAGILMVRTMPSDFTDRVLLLVTPEQHTWQITLLFVLGVISVWIGLGAEVLAFVDKLRSLSSGRYYPTDLSPLPACAPLLIIPGGAFLSVWMIWVFTPWLLALATVVAIGGIIAALATSTE